MTSGDLRNGHVEAFYQFISSHPFATPQKPKKENQYKPINQSGLGDSVPRSKLDRYERNIGTEKLQGNEQISGSEGLVVPMVGLTAREAAPRARAITLRARPGARGSRPSYGEKRSTRFVPERH